MQSSTAYQYPTEFPGFGNPVNNEPLGAYGSVLTDDSLRFPAITLSEQWMLRFMNVVTDKAEWFTKIHNDEIVAKWWQEAKGFRLRGGPQPTERMFNWCINELKHNAENIEDPSNPPPMFVFNGDVYKSDTALSLDFKQRLQRAVAAFEASIPEDRKDWHPNTDEKVWDLVHPSLFPVVFGRSRVLMGDSVLSLDDCISRCGEGVLLPVPHAWEAPTPTFSRDFQWMPCEVNISGPTARITSYINNLHPVHQKPMYGLLEELITAAIPLWDLSLSLSGGTHATIEKRVSFHNYGASEIDPRWWPQDAGVQGEIGEESYRSRRREWKDEATSYDIPQPPDNFQPIERPEPFSLIDEFKEEGLQVIVKLANIHLTPDKPTYNGGSWHVEGQLNERIIASAIYYYSNDNITESRLSFRHLVDTEEIGVAYEQDDHAWLWNIFGLKNQDSGVQDSGSVVTREGRLVTFPNIIQHRVEGFRLQDPTKPGHRKIVALFLVNPHLKILSSAKIPCQRKDWWEESQNGRRMTRKAARELGDREHAFVDFPLTMDEAKEMRLKLMKERSHFDHSQDRMVAQHTFNLCEH